MKHQSNEMKISKETHLFALVWLNSSKLNFETCLCSTEPNYQSHHSSFFVLCSSFLLLLPIFGLVWLVLK